MSTPPVAQYKLSGDLGDVLKDSIGTYDLTTLTGGLTLSDEGVYNGTARFDGSTVLGFSSPPPPLANTGYNRTICLWLYRTRVGVEERVMMTLPGTHVKLWGLKASTDLLYYQDVNFGNSAGIIPVDTWTHIAMASDDGNLVSYVNGVAQQTTNNSLSYVNSSNPFIYIGGNTTGDQFLGNMADLRVYDYQLSASEMLNLYTTGPDLNASVPPITTVLDTRSINILAVITDGAGATNFQLTYEGPTGGEITAVSGTTGLKHNITGMVPETPYNIRIYADTGSGLVLVEELPTTTLPNVSTNYDITDFQDVNGITDLSSLDATSLSNIASILPDLVDTGDVVSLTLVDNPGLTFTTFVDIGGTLDITGINGVLLPFHNTSGTGQAVSLTLSDSTTVPVTYDDQTNTISLESVTYSVGDTMLLDQKLVEVFGSNGLVVLSVDEISPSILAPSFRNILSTISDFATPGTTYNITYEGPTGGEITAFSNVTTLSNAIVGLVPNTQYTIRSYANMNGVYQLAGESIITTLENVASNYNKTDFQEGDVFNLDDLTTDELSDISSVWNGVFGTGDVVNVPLESIPESRGSFVNLGGTLSIKDVSNVIVPFDDVNGTGQDVSLTLSDNATTVTVLYDETVNTITVGGIVYLPGQSFILDGKKVTVLDI